MTKEEIFKAYAEVVCDRFKISQSQLFNKSKQREIVDARFTLYYMCSKRPMRTSQIQKFMANDDYDIAHSCIIYGIKQMTKTIDNDEDYKDVIQELENNAVHII
tara:strand:+ start:381 stop:692 length:312 start_codon:yes stop_codon:yes gene_type:complete